jgi:hypothetical protein
MGVLQSVNRKFTWMLGSCILSLVAADLVAPRLGLKYYQTDKTEDLLAIQAFERDASTYDVIFMGASRTQHGIRPAEVDRMLSKRVGREISSYVLAPPAAGMLTFATLVDELLSEDRAPEVLVLSLAPGALNSNRIINNRYLKNFASLVSLARYTPYVDTQEELDSVLYGYCRGWSNIEKALWELPNLDERKRKAAKVTASRGARWAAWSKKTPKNFAEPDPDRERVLDDFYTSMQTRNLVDFEIPGPNQLALDRIIEQCRGSGTKLVLWEEPTLIDPKRLYVAHEDQVYRSFIEELTERESLELHVITPGQLRLEPKHYIDIHHLGPDGATTLSKFWALELLPKYLGSTRNL